jgi:hypothetical protein
MHSHLEVRRESAVDPRGSAQDVPLCGARNRRVDRSEERLIARVLPDERRVEYQDGGDVGHCAPPCGRVHCARQAPVWGCETAEELLHHTLRLLVRRPPRDEGIRSEVLETEKEEIAVAEPTLKRNRLGRTGKNVPYGMAW